MVAVILQPAGDEASHKHYADTIDSPVLLDEIRPYLSSEDARHLGAIYPDGVMPVWGVTPGKIKQNATKWGRIGVGDITLFARQNRIVSSGVTTYKLHSEALARHLWKSKEDDVTWEYIYFLDEIVSHDIPVEQINLAAGYKRNNVIQGFNVLDSEKSEAILERFKLESSNYFPIVSEQDYLSALDDEANLDESSTSVRRKEQGFLRDMLFGKRKIGQCCMCGRDFPVQFLVTAHIKKRAECSLDERKDYRNIVAPMCKFGCDDLYEKHYIYVENGTIGLNEAKRSTSHLDSLTTPLNGAKCLAALPGNRKYFDWHKGQVRSKSQR